MAKRHEFEITGLNSTQALGIMTVVEQINSPGVIRGAFWGPSDPVLRVGCAADSQAELDVFLTSFRSEVLSRLGKNPDTDISRARVTDMNPKVRCQTSSERRR